MTAVADLTNLAAAVRCPVLLPGQPGYDIHRRVWNADIDRHPAAIVRCSSAADVSDALRWCADAGLPITVRGGGHNLAGSAVVDDAVMIDTSPMRSVSFDTDAGTVTVGAGCTWGDVDRPAAELGVAVPAGVVSHTGVAGLTLGGGFGYLARLLGATVDHLAELEVVLADGRVLRISENSHPELFWAMKGAGHNYAVATEFVFRYAKLPGLATVRQEIYGEADRLAVLRAFRDNSLDLPRTVTAYLRLFRCPPYWSQLPAAHRDRPVLSLATVHYGDPADEPDRSAPMFGHAKPVYSALRSIPHVTLQHATDDEFRHGLAHYWKHAFLSELSDDALRTAIEWADRYPGRPLNASAHISHQVMCPFEMISGSRAPRDSTRDSTAGVGAPFSANIGADWEFPEEKAELVAWARAFNEAMLPYQHGTYINFTSVQGDTDLARAVYGAKYERLVRVKHDYDPGNVFRRGLVDLSEYGDPEGPLESAPPAGG